MEHEAKKKSPYKGVVIVCVALIGIPIICYCIINGAVMNWLNGKFSYEENLLTSKFFATLIGFFFHISCFIAGVFKEARLVAIERRREFKDNISLSLGFAIKSYFYDIKKNGIVYLIYSVIIWANAILLVNYFYSYVTLYL